MKNNVIRIVVVGDEGVGKTSLVSAIISDLTS
jgi:GTPase SAR1 family protein